MGLRPLLPRGLELIWWWGALVGIWLITLSSVDLSEVMVSAICALPCALAALAARPAMGARWAPRLRWLGWAAPLLAAVMADAGRVLTLPPRRAVNAQRWDGEFRTTSLPENEPTETSLARRALATMIVSATPATFVVDADPEQSRLLVHSLVTARPRMEQVVSR